MNKHEFEVANELTEEGWEFICTTDAGEMMFSRDFYGIDFTLLVREDR